MFPLGPALVLRNITAITPEQLSSSFCWNGAWIEQPLWSIFSQPFPEGSVSVLRLGSEIRMLFSLSYLEIWLEDWQCYFLSHFEA